MTELIDLLLSCERAVRMQKWEEGGKGRRGARKGGESGGLGGEGREGGGQNTAKKRGGKSR